MTTTQSAVAQQARIADTPKQGAHSGHGTAGAACVHARKPASGACHPRARSCRDLSGIVGDEGRSQARQKPEHSVEECGHSPFGTAHLPASGQPSVQPSRQPRTEDGAL